MGKKIGMDVGTTYSGIAELRVSERDASGNSVKYSLSECPLGQNKPWEDSVVVKRKNGKIISGVLTRNEAGNEGTVTYKGFKMLLGEKDKTVLASRGYDEEYTPKFVTASFLDMMLQKYMKKFGGEDGIDKLVVGVPEIWFKEKNSIDCRTVLLDIIKEVPYVKEVELVSEPACASAYFVHNYQESVGKNYEGRILVIDYGGGTLDSALCKVRANGARSEIVVEKRCGAGVNEEGFIGKAGLAYIEKIIKIALKSLNLTDEAITNSQFFPKVMNAVEDEITVNGMEIEEIMEYTSKEKSILSEQFYEFQWHDIESVEITYGMLLEAYNEMIKPVLSDTLDEMIKFMDDKGINWRDPTCEDFKIALVGGFSNFCLVKEQVMDKMEHCPEDNRFKNIIRSDSDRERAIMFGAALIANDVINFKQLSPYHLGIAKTPAKKASDFYFIFRKDDEIDYEKPVFVKDEDGNKVVFAAKNIPAFVFSYSDNPFDAVAWGTPKGINDDKLGAEKAYYSIGISLDRSMIITLHFEQVDVNDIEKVIAKRQIRLAEIEPLLGNLNEVRRY